MAAKEKEQLNFLSENFDPSVALRSENVTLPSPNVPPMNNLAAYTSFMEGKRSTAHITRNSENASTSSSSQRCHINTTRSLKSGATALTTVPDRRKNTILSLMSESYDYGPLSLMKKCVNERIRVKVWTRNYTQIRGMCKGYVVAFDKHWNLALSDVDEIWQSTRNHKSPPLGDLSSFQELRLTDRLVDADENKTIPDKVEDTDLNDNNPSAASRDSESGRGLLLKGKSGSTAGHRSGKKVIHSRHVNQLFIRGDNVVMVALLNV